MPRFNTTGARMIGRDFFRHLKLLNGRTETVRTRWELNEAGQLVEHVFVWVEANDKAPQGTTGAPRGHRTTTSRRTQG